MFDIFGDIHGNAEALLEMLRALDYTEQDGVFRHQSRQAVFVGDFINRGDQIREVLKIVRPMVEHGAAQAVMGNHEFRALSFYTPDPERPGSFLRDHAEERYCLQMKKFEEQLDPEERQEALKWFITLPLWLDLDGSRVIHAAWGKDELELLSGVLSDARLDAATLVRANRRKDPVYLAVKNILAGFELPLPQGMTYLDPDGVTRKKRMRVRWFEDHRGKTYRSYALPHSAEIPDEPVDPELVPANTVYDPGEPPVFFGHYWMKEEAPRPLKPNVCCVDYGCGGSGYLCSYRFNGERTLRADNFVYLRRR